MNNKPKTHAYVSYTGPKELPTYVTAHLKLKTTPKSAR